MKAPKLPPTDLMAVTDRPVFLSDIRQAVGEPDGVRVGSVDASPRPSGLRACLAALEARSTTILVVDAEPDPAAALLLVQEIFDRQPAPRLFVAGPAGDPDLILRSHRAGAGEFLPLPLDRRSLLDAIQRLWRRLAPESHPPSRKRGRILPFLGTKGGCGTTTVATNLAVTLAGQGNSTLLVDLDLSAGDVSLLLNLNPSFSVVDVIQNAHRLDRVLLNGMIQKHTSGLGVLCASENPDRTAEVEPSKIGQILGFLREQFDCVVINTGGADDPFALAALNQADLIHLVCCLDLLSLRRAQWTLRRIVQYGLAKDLLRLVINRYEKNPYISPEEAEKVLDLKVAWTIPADIRTVQEALNEGVPFVARNRNRLHGCFETYAGRLAGRVTTREGPPPQRKILGIFPGRPASRKAEDEAPA